MSFSNIKSDRKTEYYTALDTAHCTKNDDLFNHLVADYVLGELEKKIDLSYPKQGIDDEPEIDR